MAGVVLAAIVVAPLLGLSSAEVLGEGPDPSFGDSGFVPFSSAGVFDVEVDPYGSVLVLYRDDATSEFPIARLDHRGRLDRAFGTDGVVSGVGGQDISVQPDGKLLVRGVGVNGAIDVHRLLPDGRRDTSFGGGDGHVAIGGAGYFGTDGYDLSGYGQLVVAADGRITVASNGNHAIVLGRLLPDGRLDTSFGGDGFIRHERFSDDCWFQPCAGNSDRGRLRVVDLVANRGGFTLALGQAGRYPAQPWLLRLRGDGSRDPSFGHDGAVPLDSGFYGHEPTVSIAPDQRVTVLLADRVMRFEPDGDPDPTWGADGVVETQIGSLFAGLLLSDGRFAVSHNARYDSADPDGGGILVFTSTGEPDPSVGTGGDIALHHVPLDLAEHCEGRPVYVGRRFESVSGVGRVTLPGAGGSGEGGYVVMPHGGLHAFAPGTAPPPACGGPRLATGLVRGVAVGDDAAGGWVLDGWGALHSYGGRGPVAAPARGGPWWPGWDIARSLATMPNGSGGFVVDGWGGLHGFSTGSGDPPRARGGPWWQGWDIARDVVVLPDGLGGYVLDGWGGLHRFAVGSAPLPPPARGGPWWQGWDIARDVVVLPDGLGGYILDGWGGLHRFAVGSAPLPPPARGGPWFPGRDVARAVVLLDDGTGGYVVDDLGGMHPFSTGAQPPPPRPDATAYWTGGIAADAALD